MVDAAEREAVAAKFIADYGWSGPVFVISALDGSGCRDLIYAVMDYLQTLAPLPMTAPDSLPVAPGEAADQ
jgi:GTP-binding protein